MSVILFHRSIRLGCVFIIVRGSAESLACSFLGSIVVLITEALGSSSSRSLASVKTFLVGHVLDVGSVFLGNRCVGHVC